MPVWDDLTPVAGRVAAAVLEAEQAARSAAKGDASAKAPPPETAPAIPPPPRTPSIEHPEEAMPQSSPRLRLADESFEETGEASNASDRSAFEAADLREAPLKTPPPESGRQVAAPPLLDVSGVVSEIDAEDIDISITVSDSEPPISELDEEPETAAAAGPTAEIAPTPAASSTSQSGISLHAEPSVAASARSDEELSWPPTSAQPPPLLRGPSDRFQPSARTDAAAKAELATGTSAATASQPPAAIPAAALAPAAAAPTSVSPATAASPLGSAAAPPTAEPEVEPPTLVPAPRRDEPEEFERRPHEVDSNAPSIPMARPAGHQAPLAAQEVDSNAPSVPFVRQPPADEPARRPSAVAAAQASTTGGVTPVRMMVESAAGPPAPVELFAQVYRSGAHPTADISIFVEQVRAFAPRTFGDLLDASLSLGE